MTFWRNVTFILIMTIGGGQGRISPKLYRDDPMKEIVIQPNDVFKFTTQPSNEPTNEPSIQPSSYPTRSVMPTSSPTLPPSIVPTYLPSDLPSNFPTGTSYSPSNLPTETSYSPSLVPTIRPTNVESLSPSDLPSNLPTETSDLPSLEPTNRPSNVESPSPSEISEMYPIDVPDPSDESFSYFNYNPFDTNFGPGRPTIQRHAYNESVVAENTTTFQQKSFNYTSFEGNKWGSIRDNLEHKYWDDFNSGRSMRNKCENSPVRKQSPIDLCDRFVNAECFEHHQIRVRGGDYQLDDAEVDMQILPSKLRILYSRDNSDLDESKRRAPHGDFAHNWNGYVPVTNIDIKIPSEHTICGKRFAGEYQIYFYHPKRRQAIVQSILIEIHPTERPHLHFQKALNEWQAISDRRKMHCWNKNREAQKNEEIFVRRMKNVLLTSIDSHEVSAWVDSKDERAKDRENGSGNNMHMGDHQTSTMMDEPQENSDQFRKLLEKVIRRASNPVFEEHYEKVDLSSAAIKPDLEDSTNSKSSMNRHLRNTESYYTAIPKPSPASEGDIGITATSIPHYSDSLSPTSAPYDTYESLPSNSPTSVSSDSTTLRKTAGTENTSVSQTPSFSPSPAPSKSSHLPSSAPTSSPSLRPRWNPFRPRIVNSIYFYGYGGSLTEPPCSEFVSWRVLDTPMQINTAQWEQIRDILFGQVDDDCKRSSVHWRGSVARPTQSLNERDLWRCLPSDYESDFEKRNPP